MPKLIDLPSEVLMEIRVYLFLVSESELLPGILSELSADPDESDPSSHNGTLSLFANTRTQKS